MNKIRVFIATTEGPAEVQRISEEDPEVQSVICLDGQAIALPVSAAYEAFVRRPTGVIEAAYGHPAFRLDVAKPISDGLSWQLGVLIAHGLAAAGRLAGHTDAAAEAVWLTGEVDRDLNVRPIAHLREKLGSSGRLLAELKAAGLPVTLFAPRDSLAALAPAWLASLGLGGETGRVVPLETAQQAFTALGLKPPGAYQASAAQTRLPRRAMSLAAGAVVAVGLVTAALIARDVAPEAVPAAAAGVAAPAPLDRLETKAVELRAAGGASCAALRMGVAEPERVVRRPDKQGSLTSEAAASLCALVYEITNGGRPLELWLLAARSGADAGSLDTTALLQARPLAGGESLTVEVRVPRRLEGPLVQHLALVPAAPGAADMKQYLAETAAGLERRVAPADWQGLIDRLGRSGLAVTEIRHELTP